jgi:hypothetical protein
MRQPGRRWLQLVLWHYIAKSGNFVTELCDEILPVILICSSGPKIRETLSP